MRCSVTRASVRLLVAGVLAPALLAGGAQPATAARVRPVVAHAIAWEAPVTGDVGSLEVRIAARRRERVRVVVSDAGDRPLASAVVTVRGSGWRRVAVPAFGVIAGRRYWIAVDARESALRLIRAAVP
jgi:hypothetical protein